MASVCSERITHMSSANFAVCGSSSLNHRPDLTVLRELENRRRDGKAFLPSRHASEPLFAAHGVGQILVE